MRIVVNECVSFTRAVRRGWWLSLLVRHNPVWLLVVLGTFIRLLLRSINWVNLLILILTQLLLPHIRLRSCTCLANWSHNHATLLCDEAVLDDLVNIFSLRVFTVIILLVILDLRVTVFNDFVQNNAELRHHRVDDGSTKRAV